jgi:hypothetical protein
VPAGALLIGIVTEPANAPPAGESTSAAAVPVGADPLALFPTVSVVNPGQLSAT